MAKAVKIVCFVHTVSSLVLLMFFCAIHADVKVVENTKQVIESFHVHTDIRYRFATTQMASVIRNTAGVAREIPFHVTLPKEAFIVSFSMMIDGKVYQGEVKGKQEAKEQYNRAVSRGQSAGHIRQTPRHSNRFDVSVNVANGSAVNFTLTYQQILTRKHSMYEYEMHVEPGQAVQDFMLEVYIQENRPLRFVKTPKLRTSSVITNDVEEPSDLATVDLPSDTTAHVTYRPTMNQQGDDGLAARFVVQYDVKRADKGDLLVVDGYFLHLFAPKVDIAPLPKDIIFVLDVSGSMFGLKMKQLKDAMHTILDDLSEADRFNIFTFSNSVTKWKTHLTETTNSSISEAKGFVGRMTGVGGTNINDALLTSIKELRNRENHHNRMGMIFFLTDGTATAGETNPLNIAKNVQESNDNMAIYSLAFRSGANFDLLKTISTQNSGFARKIYDGSDASLQVSSLYQELSTVAMKNVSIEYLPGLPTTDTEFPVLFNGSELMVLGHLPREMDSFQMKMSGVERSGSIDMVIDINDVEAITINLDDALNQFFSMPRDLSGVVEKMWAFLTIQQMLKEKVKVAEDKVQVESLDKKVLEMSLKYQFVTPLTSMVVTKPETDSEIEVLDDDNDTVGLHPSFAFAKAHSQSSRKGKGRYHLAISQSDISGPGPHPAIASSRYPGYARYHSLAKPAIGISGQRGRGRQMSAKRNHIKNRGQPPSTGLRKTPGKSVLSSIVLERTKTNDSHCLVPKRWINGTYVLLEMDNGIKIELSVKCFTKKCRWVVPNQLILTSIGKTSTVNLTASSSWQFKQHQDFDVAFAKRKMRLKNKDVVISIIKRESKRQTRFFLRLVLKSHSGFSGMMDFLQSPVTKRGRKPKVDGRCKLGQTKTSAVCGPRKALKYLVTGVV